MSLIDILRKFKWAFILTVSLVVIEKLAWIVEPTVFGRLLDALIDAATVDLLPGHRHPPLFHQPFVQ
jgi:hypothetical protein